MEEQFAVGGWALTYTALAALNVWSAVVSDGWHRGLASAAAVFVGLVAIRRIVEDAVNYLAVS